MNSSWRRYALEDARARVISLLTFFRQNGGRFYLVEGDRGLASCLTPRRPSRFHQAWASSLLPACDYFPGMSGSLRVDCVRCGKTMKPGPENWKGRPAVSICDECSTRASRLEELKRERRQRAAKPPLGLSQRSA